MRKEIAVCVCLLMAGVASAGESVTPGNVLQPSCGIPAIFPESPYSGITMYGIQYTPKDTRSGIGQVLAKGGLVFYASLVQAGQYFVPPKRVEILDKNPLTRDLALEPGRRYPVAGVYTNRAGRRFYLLNEPSITGYLLVREDGMLCSDRIGLGYDKRNIVSEGMPQAYQEVPLEMVMEEASNTPYKMTVAVTIKDINAAVAVLETTILAGSTQKLRKESAVDMIGGGFNLGGLAVKLATEGDRARVVAVDEPSDWTKWLQDVAGTKR